MSKGIVQIIMGVMVGSLPLLAHALTEDGFPNPLEGQGDFSIFLSNIIGFLLGLVGLLALLALIVGGIRLVVSFGNDQHVASAKKMIFWAIAGLTIAILSWVIVRIITNQVFGIQESAMRYLFLYIS